MSRVVGIDVGGANLKYATADRTIHRRRFPMWRSPERLADAIAEDLKRFASVDLLAVTMTGELADSFADRAIGVAHIVAHVIAAAAEREIDADRVGFYGVDGRFHGAAEATSLPDVVAAANWHALASEVAASIAGSGLLIDIGSTTTDIVSLAGGVVATTARNDHQRLIEGSLVYVGCRRTPVCALLDRLSFRGRESRVMNEVFATIDDARLVMGLCPTDSEDRDTADGQPRTPQHAANRLARMIGLDRRSVGVDEARELAEQILAAAKASIWQAVQIAQTAGRGPWILSGHGPDLLEIPTGQPVIDLSVTWGRGLSRCAPSYAVAMRWLAERTARLTGFGDSIVTNDCESR